MNTALRSFCPMLIRVAFVGAFLLHSYVDAQDPAPSAKDLAARLSASVLDGSSAVRLKMELKPASGGPKTSLQLQIKSRRTQAASEVVYQVLWPKERKGESILVRKKAGQSATGTVFVPPDSIRTLSASQLKEGVFGSDLAYVDLVENFFSWENQAIVGTETVDRIPCQILESKPGKGDGSSYALVRSWVDTKKLVPMRVEKYTTSGQLVRRIDSTRVAKDDVERPVAASLQVRRPGQESVTDLEGSNSRHDVTFSDGDFTPDAMRSLVVPGSQGK